MGPCPRGGDAFFEGGGQHTTLIESRHPRRFLVNPKHMVWLVIARLDATEPLCQARKGADWHKLAVR